jgi:chromosomal replication initiation ATPase DnaA
MARPYRLQAKNCLYHIISRGDDRKRIYTIPSDYGRFMDYVVKAQERYQDLERQIVGEEGAQKRALCDDQDKVERIIQSVEKHFCATLDHIKASRTRPMRVKQVLIYLLREYTGLTNRAIGGLCGMRYPAVSKAGLTMKRILNEDTHLKRTINRIVSSFQV